MSCTLSQLLANRLNTLRSTGPKSAEGKARSSRNARSHGLSRAVGAAPPLEWANLVESRKTSWRTSYQPKDEAQNYLFDRLVAESVRLDQCEARIQAARIEFADRAVESWDDDRRAEVAELAARLARHPERIQAQLLQSKHGVEWMLNRWEEIAATLAQFDSWSQPLWHSAMDLLGLPIESRITTGPWSLDPEDPGAAPGLAFIHEVMDALRARLAGFLIERDDRARADAELGFELIDPKPIRLLERYAADARRRVRWSLTELRKLQSAAPAEQSSPAESPESGPPSPRPDRRNVKQEKTLSAENVSARNEPNASETPARNEPIPAASRPSTAPRPSLGGSSQPAVLLNRRARRAQAAASRRRS